MPSRPYSTSQSLKQLSLTDFDPQFITGFSDGEGCFHIGFSKNEKYSTK